MTSAVALFSGGIGSWAAAKRAKASYDEIVLLFPKPTPPSST